MSDLISRRKAFEYFVTLWECIGTIMDRDEWEDVCMTTANEIPAAQPEKRTEEHAETHACDSVERQAVIDALKDDWIDGTCGARYFPIRCSACGYSTYDDDATKFCPNCGARMENGDA